MKLEYVLVEKDFIEFHLFAISEHKKHKRMIGAIKCLLIGLFLYLGIQTYHQNNFELAIILVIMAILTALFFNKLYALKLRRHFAKIVKNNYAIRIGKKEIMEFNSDFIITKDTTGERKTNLSEVVQINETRRNFFIKLSDGSSFIVSKNESINIASVKRKWKEMNIPVSENLTWEWH